jgi:hypothetical protein
VPAATRCLTTVFGRNQRRFRQEAPVHRRAPVFSRT